MVEKIVIIKEDKPIDQVILKTEPITIGRKADCEIPIKDPAVSGTHARIFRSKEGYVIEDLGSTNGVHMSGKKISRHLLKHEDIVTIGEHKLKFLSSADTTMSGVVSAERLRKSPQRDVTTTRPPKPAAGPPGSPPSKPVVEIDRSHGHLVIRNGAGRDEKIDLTEALTTVGEPGIQVAAVSRRPQGHFIIHVDGGKDKTKVPLVNGEPTGFKSRRLEPGDIIEIAGVQMEYCV